MSQMLEQAIIDADALKEAALKNAEQSILEKYSKEVKGFVDSLLEQPLEDPEAGLEALPMTEPTLDAPATDEFPDMPRADVEGEELCPCPEEEEEWKIDFDSLATQMKAEEEEELAGAGELAGEFALGSEDEEELAKRDLYEQELDITEEDIAKILEELTVDIKNVPTGQAGGASNETMDKDNEEIALAAEAQEEAVEELDEDEEKEELKEELKTFKERNEKSRSKNKKLSQQNKELTNLLVRLKDTLEEVQTSNAKLFYTNKTLISTSLNERQKTKIVEAINKVNTVEEAKVIYETLQSAVGTHRKRMPKSLSEAVSRPSTTLPRRNEAKKSDPISTRWKALAGIK